MVVMLYLENFVLLLIIHLPPAVVLDSSLVLHATPVCKPIQGMMGFHMLPERIKLNSYTLLAPMPWWVKLIEVKAAEGD